MKWHKHVGFSKKTHYKHFFLCPQHYNNFGDIIKETIYRSRQVDKMESAAALVLCLQQVKLISKGTEKLLMQLQSVPPLPLGALEGGWRGPGALTYAPMWPIIQKKGGEISSATWPAGHSKAMWGVKHALGGQQGWQKLTTTLSLSSQLFTRLKQEQESGGRVHHGVQTFTGIRELARRFALTFGDLIKFREGVVMIHWSVLHWNLAVCFKDLSIVCVWSTGMV